MRHLYSVLLWLSIPLVLLRLKRRAKINPGYAQNVPERFGHVPFQTQNSIWLHCVSLGESIAATPIIRYLLKQYPTQPIVITNTTPTGRAHIEKTFGEQVHHCYLPYDLPRYLKRFLRATQPTCCIIMETELWPNFLAMNAKCGIPTLLANARLSERSAKGYGKIAWLTRPMMQALSCVAVQSEPEAKRFEALGLAPQKAHVTGSIKFDITVPSDLEKKAAPLRKQFGKRPVWVAASTHEGEEQEMLKAHRLILEKHPSALLILVPRHPERFKTVFTECQQAGFETVARSSDKPCQTKTQIYLGDTMGEMLVFFAASDIDFIGGSFAPIGGHNLLEAAILSKPTLTGPHTHNFLDITKQLIAHDATYRVENASVLTEKVCELIEDPKRAQTMGANGKNLIEANRGALAKLCKLIDSQLAK